METKLTPFKLHPLAASLQRRALCAHVLSFPSDTQFLFTNWAHERICDNNYCSSLKDTRLLFLLQQTERAIPLKTQPRCTNSQLIASKPDPQIVGVKFYFLLHSHSVQYHHKLPATKLGIIRPYSNRVSRNEKIIKIIKQVTVTKLILSANT